MKVSRKGEGVINIIDGESLEQVQRFR